MKISPLTAAARFINQVREKRDSGENPRQERDPGQGGGSSEQGAGGDDSQEALDEAIEQFASDEQARAAGLSVGKIGYGPGLRIVLKDSSGSVVRQLTGSEFVQLRTALKGGGHAPGKILDRKL